MKKYTIILCTVLMIVFTITGCSIQSDLTEKKAEIQICLVSNEQIPEEFLEKINEAKHQEMKLTFQDQENLYIARGYGVVKNGNYSISVDALYETENAICIETTLIGPSVEEQQEGIETTPYVVLKLPASDKTVIFDSLGPGMNSDEE